MPAQAGIQFPPALTWIPAFAGMTAAGLNLDSRFRGNDGWGREDGGGP